MSRKKIKMKTATLSKFKIVLLMATLLKSYTQSQELQAITNIVPDYTTYSSSPTNVIENKQQITNSSSMSQNITESESNEDCFCVFGGRGQHQQCEVCVPGFTITAGNIHCTECEPGFYKTEYSINSCTPCPAGWSTDSLNGQTSCTKCAPGSSTTGASGQSVCTQCAPNSEALVAGTPSCTCILGASLDYTGSECVPCPTGTYAKYSNSDSLSGQLDCIPCVAGTFSSMNAATLCSFCSPGKYAAIGGFSACSDCPLNTISTAVSQTSCQACAAGTYTLREGSSTFCMCPAGMQPSVSNYTPSSRCEACEPGFYQPINETEGQNGLDIFCMPCEPGKYGAVGSLSACSDCPLNTISTAVSQTSCQACAAGTYTLREGSSTFCMCPAGMQPSVSNYTPSSRCEACLPGFYQPINEIGEQNRPNIFCMPCEPGTYNAKKQQAICTQCPIGKYEPALGSTGCIDCGPYSTTTNNSKQNSAADCKCLSGAARSFQQGTTGVADCILCPAGFYQPEVGQDCIGCPQHKTNIDSGSTACDYCIGGAFAIMHNNSNSNNNGTIIECDLCKPGSYQSSIAHQQTFCMQCPAGTFSNLSGAAYCKMCSPNFYAGAIGSTECSICPTHSNTIGLEKSTTCTCDLGYYYDYHSEYGASCIACPYGYFQDVQGASCKACGKGTYNSIAGSSACSGCASGTFASDGGLSACVSCPINTTSSYFFSYLLLSLSLPFTITECKPCEDQSYTLQEGSLFCICPAGTYPLNNEYHDQSSILLFLHRCHPCDAGFYQPYDEGASLTLPDNSIQCDICEPGKYSQSEGSSSCMLCDIGKYASGWGSANCTECGPFETTLHRGQTSGDECKCIPGSTLDFLGKSCIPCPIGFYQNDSDSRDCLACTGYFTNLAAGSTTCDSCLAGSLLFFSTPDVKSYNNSASSTECKPCRPGFYQPESQQTQCLQCPAGSFSNTAGSTYCSLCEQNSFASVDGSAGCLPCPPYSETGGVSGSTRCACTLGSSISIYDTCIPCPSGSFQAQRGGPCQPCAAGTITPNEGSSGALACVFCAQGTFAASAGLSVCTQCPALSDTQERVGASRCTCISGTGIDDSGTQCIECTAGYYNTAGLKHCIACPGGFFSNQTRSTACMQCPQEMYSQSTTGSTVCLKCEGGSISWKNQTSCTCSEALHMFNKTITTNGTGGWKCTDCTPSCDYTTSYQVQGCNPHQDTVCKNCSLECPSGRFMTAGCTATQDIICKPCSQTCSMGYFMKSKCSEMADIICEKCTSKCPTYRYAATEACTYSHDLICSLCPPGTYVKDNSVCAECLDGYASTSFDEKCVLCGQGFYSNPNKTMCVKQCPPNTYPSSSKGCSKCPPLSEGNGMGCYHIAPLSQANNNNNITSIYNYSNSSGQICKPNFTFEIKEL
jgi:hypothetical protein